MSTDGQQWFPFPSPSDHIKVAQPEPTLWIRRIVVWSEPHEKLRDIAFRRGVNIIWSPDPGARELEPGADAETGHGAGKTLLSRLIRYCLGENHFGTRDVESRVAIQFPEGYVGAEVIIKGRPWAVVRPLGMRKKEWAAPDCSVEALFDPATQGTGIAPLHEALTEAFVAPLGDVLLPTSGARPAWLHLLSWLARDQECRFDSILAWRHHRAEAESPTQGLGRDDVGFVARSFLGIMSDDEQSERASQQQRITQKERLQRRAEHLQFSVDRQWSSLVKRMGLADTDSPTLPRLTELQAAQAANLAEKQRTLKADPMPDPALEELRAKHQKAVEELAIAGYRLEQQRKATNLHEHHLAALKGDRPRIEAREVKAALESDRCPVCQIDIEQAVAEGCPYLADRKAWAAQAAQEVAENAEALARAQWSLDQARAETRRLQHSHQSSIDAERALKRDVSLAEQARARQQQELQAPIEFVRRLVVDIETTRALVEERDKVLADVKELERQMDASNKRQEDIRHDFAATTSRLQEHFEYSVKAMLGNRAMGTLTLSDRNFACSIDLHGDRRTVAMDTIKVISFDVAAMLFGIEGRGCLPAFLLHDSPREADIALSIYQRLLRHVADLERLGTPPPFQYIVTTTTDPPKELQKKQFTILRLVGTPAGERLLKTDL